MFPHLHSQTHFALPGFESGSFSITFNLPNVLPLKSMRVGEGVCRRQPHDFVPLVRSRFVEDTTTVLPHSHRHNHIGRPGFLSSTLFITVSISSKNIFRMMMSEMRVCTASVFCGSTLSL